jgi:hypothetical protein
VADVKDMEKRKMKKQEKQMISDPSTGNCSTMNHVCPGRNKFPMMMRSFVAAIIFISQSLPILIKD